MGRFGLTRQIEGELAGFLSDLRRDPPESIKGLSQEAQQMIYLSRGLIHKIIPSILNKEVDLNFGNSKCQAILLQQSPSLQRMLQAKVPNSKKFLITACASCLTKHFKDLEETELKQLALYLLSQALAAAKREGKLSTQSDFWKKHVASVFREDFSIEDLKDFHWEKSSNQH